MKQAITGLLSRWGKFWKGVEGPELEPPIWHSHFLSAHTAEQALHRLGGQLSGLVIDIGAGTGHGSRYLAAGPVYFPTDIPGGRDGADPQISKKGLPLAAECSVYDLPFDAGHFGGAMMLSVLEHLERPETGLAELRRVVTPGGRLLMSVPFAFPLHGAPHDFRRWTAPGLELELRKAGFAVEGLVPCGGVFSAAVLNILLVIRYSIPERGPVWAATITLMLPVLIILQAVLNGMALALDHLDKDRRLPISFVVLARAASSDVSAESGLQTV